MPGTEDTHSLRDKALKEHLEKIQAPASPGAAQLFQQLSSGDRVALAKAITIAESSLDTDRAITLDLLHHCLSNIHSAYRIGVTGVPGVGKSTFLNKIAKLAADNGKRVAILTIDPTSPQTGGSILGDKTRMDDLAGDERIFVRPSPSGMRLGGVAHHTREAIVLCEAAGFDTIFIETVGVGQSETAIADLADFFLLLALPGAGDELQGIKRGIMELADAIFVNKADGDMATLAEVARQAYSRSLHLFPARPNGWTPRVQTGSSLTGQGIAEIWETMTTYLQQGEANGALAANRERQLKLWMHQSLQEMIAQKLARPEAQALIQQQEAPVAHRQKSPPEAAGEIFDQLFGA